jgi:hypothetical protein
MLDHDVELFVKNFLTKINISSNRCNEIELEDDSFGFVDDIVECR